MRIGLALAAALLSFGLFFMLIRIRMRQHKDLVNRMEYFSGAAMRLRQQELRGHRAKYVAKDRFRHFVQRAGSWVRKLQHSDNPLDFKMQQVDWPLLGAEFEVILGLFGALCGVIALAATLELVWAVAAFAAGVLLGLMFLNIYIKRRQKVFTTQLGDMLIMVANALRAGFSFMQAFELIAREMDAPIGREVQKVVREVNIGVDLETALDNMQKRVNSSDFELVVTAVVIQRQVGGNLAQILDTISDTINNRVRMRREVMTLTAQGRASGIVLALLPVALGLVLSIVNPAYLQPLFTEPIGRACIGVAVIMEAIGYLVIRRIVNIRI